MFKKLFLILSLGLFMNSNAQVIVDFENGASSIHSGALRNQNGISFTSINCGISPLTGNQFLYINGTNLVDDPNLKISLVSQGNYEPLLLNHGIQIYTVPSNGGKYALRLNDITTEKYDISSYTKTFTAKNEYVSFDYLAVLDSPHFDTLPVQPFFTARLLDEQNNIIQNTQFCLIADKNDPLLINPKYDLLYTKDWFCGMIKIPKKYIGKKVKIQFMAADCGWGGDIGVAYVDNVVNELSCDKPTYGFISLDEFQYPCPKEKFSVCGNYSAPTGSTIQDMVLEIKKNGVVINTIQLDLNTIDKDAGFCFEVAPHHFGNLSGNYEFNVVASFVTPSGFKYILTYESTYDGPDVSCDEKECDEVVSIDYTIEKTPANNGHLITFPSFGNGNNYHLQLSQDYVCCGLNYMNDNIIVDYFITTNSFSTVDAGYYYYNAHEDASNPKCYRWRVKLDECTWSEWCCVSLTAIYDGYDCKRSTSDFFTYSAKPKPEAKAYPNPTSDYVIIENSEASIFNVYDLNGQKVKATLFDKSVNEVKIDISNLKPGIYIIKSNINEEFKVIKK